jgi:hypothetical protein
MLSLFQKSRTAVVNFSHLCSVLPARCQHQVLEPPEADIDAADDKICGNGQSD